MTWALLALWTSLVLVVAAFIVGVVDEFRRPPSSMRRAGVGLALVVGFAALWTLSTPMWLSPEVNCGPPIMALVELGAIDPAAPVECSAPMMRYAISSLVAACLAPVLVLSTRLRPD